MKTKQEPMQNPKWVLNVSTDVLGKYKNRCEIYTIIVEKELLRDH